MRSAARCHSATGDLKGIGGRYDPLALARQVAAAARADAGGA